MLISRAPTYSHERTPFYTEYTDVHGHYDFVGVPPGIYRLSCGDTVKDRGYQFEYSDVIRISDSTASRFDISGY